MPSKSSAARRRIPFRTVRAIVAAGLVPLSLGAGAATIFSETFSGGNPVPSTAYSLVNAGVSTTPGQYRVITNPATDFTNGYVSYFDHTSGTASGLMMFFDGSTSGSPTLYSATASLVAGSAYTFSFWGSSGSASSPPVLAAQIDGVTVGTPLTTTSGTWTQYTFSFNAAATGPSTFRIFDTNLESNGNDGGLDDILLVGPSVVGPPTTGIPEPEVVTLLAAGVMAAAVRRVRRRGAR